MGDGDIPPLGLEILEDEPAMTTLCSRLAAEKHSRYGEEIGTDTLLDAPFRQKCEKKPLVLLPAIPALAVIVQQRLSRRQQRLVPVLRPADLSAVLQTLDDLQQLLTLLEPGLRIGGALQIRYLAVSVHHDRGRALNDQKHPLKIESVIHLVLRVGQDRKGQVQRGAVSGGAVQ